MRNTFKPKTIGFFIAWKFVLTLLKQFREKRNEKYCYDLYSKTKHLCKYTVNGRLEDNDIDVEVELDFKKTIISKNSGISTVQNYVSFFPIFYYFHKLHFILFCPLRCRTRCTLIHHVKE